MRCAWRKICWIKDGDGYCENYEDIRAFSGPVNLRVRAMQRHGWYAALNKQGRFASWPSRTQGVLVFLPLISYSDSSATLWSRNHMQQRCSSNQLLWILLTWWRCAVKQRKVKYVSKKRYLCFLVYSLSTLTVKLKKKKNPFSMPIMNGLGENHSLSGSV